MAIIQISKIQVRTGANVDLPQLDVGEIGFATDTHQLYIGNDPNLDPPIGLSPTVTEIVTKKATGGTNLGNIGNVHILGGASGQTIVTDGNGNLSFSTVALYSNSNVANYLVSYSGNLNANNVTIQGNLNVVGTTTTTNQATLSVSDHNIILNAGTTGTPSFNAALVVDRGSSANTELLWNESSGTWQQTRNGTTFYNIPINTTELIEGSNLYFTTARANTAIHNYLPTFTGNILAGNANLGNTVIGNYFVGNGSLLTGLASKYNDSNVAIYLPNYAGNLSAINANLGNSVVGNYFTGNLYGVANIATIAYSVDGANVNGQSGNALVSGTVYTNAQPNITSVGTLSRVTVTANIISGNVYANSGIIGANYFIGDGSNISNITGGNITSQVGNALIAGTIYTNAQPNITSVGTLSGLSVTANIISGNASLGNLIRANYISLNNSANITGNITSGNANLGNAVVANYFVGNLYGTANIANIGLRTAWSNITGKPTTISGYGITDSYADSNVSTYLGSGSTVTILTTGNITANVINSTSANLGDISNLTITGGSAGQFITTDGTGNISFALVATEAPFIRITASDTGMIAVVGGRYGVDTTGGAIAIRLPSSPSTGDAVYFIDYGDAFATHNLTITRNGHTIMGLAEDMIVSINGQSFGLSYNGTTWRVY